MPDAPEPALDPADLAADAEVVLGTAEVEAVPIDPHQRVHSVTGGVYRVRSRAAPEATAVVKLVQHTGERTTDGLWGADLDEGARNYWKREWHAFDSGLLAGLPGHLHAPRLLLASEQSPTRCRIWMAEVTGRTGPALTDADVVAIAFALGSTQGSYAAGATALPRWPWLSRDWLSGWVQACAAFVGEDPDPRVHALWERRDDLLAVVASAPATLVHCDFWPTNLFVDGDTVTAIDWSQVGIGVLAQDLDQLTLDPLWMQTRPGGSVAVQEELVLPSYAAGLRAAGLAVSDTDLDRWYAAAAALHYGWLGGRLGRHDAQERAALEHRVGQPYDAVVADRRQVVERALELGARALGSLA